jgi:hypothetical protein
MGHTARVQAREVEATVHPKLNPKKLNGATGTVLRDSRDNSTQPNSLAIAVIFDTTGSMRRIPEIFVEKLPDLMDLLLKKGYVPEPQILFGAVNDATTDPVAALEIGQFESGNQMDDVLTNILLQGGGGNGVTESYELAMYFMARHTALDCFEKRGKKGYLIMIGDEIPYDSVDPVEVAQWIGDDLQAPIPTADIVAELKEKYEVFWLCPAGAANYGNKSAEETMKGYFGQNYLQLKNPADVATAIAAIIAIGEGRNPRTVKAELAEAGAIAEEVQAIVDAIPPRPLDDI